MTLKIPDAGKQRDGQTAAVTADIAHSAAGQSGTKSQSGTKARPVSTRSVDMDDVDDDPPVRNEPAAEAPPREKLRFVPVPRGPFSAGRVPQ